MTKTAPSYPFAGTSGEPDRRNPRGRRRMLPAAVVYFGNPRDDFRPLRRTGTADGRGSRCPLRGMPVEAAGVYARPTLSPAIPQRLLNCPVKIAEADRPSAFRRTVRTVGRIRPARATPLTLRGHGTCLAAAAPGSESDLQQPAERPSGGTPAGNRSESWR